MTGAAIPPDVVADAAAAARGWLRAAPGDDEAAIATLAASAIALAEAFCGQVLVARTWRDILPAGDGGWWALRALPVTAITTVTDAAGTALASDGYAIDIDADGIGWVRLTRPIGGTVSVTYAAGLAVGWADLPPPIAQGVAMLVAYLFDNRDGAAAPPAAVAALWRPWRRMRLLAGRHA